MSARAWMLVAFAAGLCGAGLGAAVGERCGAVSDARAGYAEAWLSGDVIVASDAATWREVATEAVARADALAADRDTCDRARVLHLLQFHPEALYRSADITDDDDGVLP